MESAIHFYIITFNRIQGLNYALDFARRSTVPIKPIIVDMGSTWQPFLDHINSIPEAKIFIPNRFGPRDLWSSGVLERVSTGPFFLSDGDLDYRDVPGDAFERVIEISSRYPWIPKVGLGLKTDDLPNDVEGDRVRNWDVGNMKFAIEEDIFLSSLDTTFAYYPNRLVPFHYRPAIRLGGDYRAIHYPWYERLENYDEEARNYHQRANPNISSGKDGKHVTWVIRLKKFSWTLIFFFCKYSIKSRFLGTLSVKLLSFRGTIPRKKTL